MKQLIILSIIIGSFIFNTSAQSDFFVKDNNIEKWYINHPKIENEIKKVINIPEFNAVAKNKTVEELTSSFHFIDFDNNGISDLLFMGKIIDSYYTFVFYKKGDDYLLSVGEEGTIVRANFPYQDNGLCFTLSKNACCGNYIGILTQYACVSTNNTSYFNVMNKSLVYSGTVLPSVRIEKPVAFKTNTVAAVRIEPFINDDKPIGGKFSWKGNFVGSYPPNATGTIYAEMMDSKNQYWYFVRMNNESGIDVHNNRFLVEDKEKYENCFTYGWINSNDITLTGN